MSIEALLEPAVAPLVEGACASLAQAGEVGLAEVSDSDVAAAVVAATEVMRRAEAFRLALLAEADRRQVADADASTGTDAWAAALTGDRREVLRGGLRLARLLESTYAATREAFAAGRIGVAQVRVIVNAAEQAPDDASDVQIAQAELWLVDKATGDSIRTGRPMDARRLRQAARRMFAHLDTDLADRHEAILLGRAQREAEALTYLMVGDNGDGTWTGKFTIPELHGLLLQQALDRLTAPRRLNRNPVAGGSSVVDESAPGTGNGVSHHEAQGAAFCELLEHLPQHGWAANGVTMLITMTLAGLVDGLVGAGKLDTGAAVSASEARRLACTAGLIPAVLGGTSVPLDLGREERLHTLAQRRALASVYDSCGITTCERPFAWSEIHHEEFWSRGGSTDLAHAVPLCGHHHRRAHDGHFDLRRQPGGGWRLHPRR